MTLVIGVALISYLRCSAGIVSPLSEGTGLLGIDSKEHGCNVKTILVNIYNLKMYFELTIISLFRIK